MTAPDLTQGERLRIAATLADELDGKGIEGLVSASADRDILVFVYTRSDLRALGSCVANLVHDCTTIIYEIHLGNYCGVPAVAYLPVGVS